MDNVDARIIQELRDDANTTESKLASLETGLKELITEGKSMQRIIGRMENVTYIGFIVLLVMVAGMLFDFFSVRRAEMSPVNNNYYYRPDSELGR